MEPLAKKKPFLLGSASGSGYLALKVSNTGHLPLPADLTNPLSPLHRPAETALSVTSSSTASVTTNGGSTTFIRNIQRIRQQLQTLYRLTIKLRDTTSDGTNRYESNGRSTTATIDRLRPLHQVVPLTG